MVRRNALARVGGWDERFWLWYEDVDISRRLRALGPALYVPTATFEHVGAASTGGWRKHEQRARLYHGSMVYAQSHLSRLRQAAFGAAMLAACLPRWVLANISDPAAASAYRRLTWGAIAMCMLRPLPAPQFDLDRASAE
jgi:GT2 family glycosyltransferase